MKYMYVFVTLFLMVSAVSAQTINGRISNAGGEPVAGATITITNTFIATTSDKDGIFQLPSEKTATSLLVTSAGYEPTQHIVQVGRQDGEINIVLNRSISSLKEVTVTASRKPEVVDRTPAAVQVINSKDIQARSTISNNLPNILGQAVPSLGLSSNTTSNTGQTLRGRTPLILIDGIPQSTPLRNGARDMRTIDPSVIGRIEVIKGATAMYGNGADGGVINYITLQPKTAKKFEAQTSLVKTGMAAHANETGGFRINQQMNGRIKSFDYVVAANYEKTGVYKDAKGTVITPIYSYGESDIINTFAKLGYNIGDQQRIEVMYNYFSSKQNSDYIEQIGKYGETPTIGIKGSVQAEDEGTRYNHNAYVKYQVKNLFLNTSLEASAYMQKFFTVYGWSASFVPAGQSTIHSGKKGLRLTLNTPINFSEKVQSELVYGVDYLKDITWQSLTDGRVWVPRMQMTNPAPFAQFNVTIKDYWIFKAGYRLDQVDLDIPSFTQIKTSQTEGGQVINGGKLDFSASTFNAGLRYAKWEFFKPFVSFTQGFSMIDIGLYVRSAKENDIAKMQLEPVVVNNYEAGFSSSFNKVSLNMSLYASTSKIGSTIVEENGYFRQQRAPERIIGFESSVDVSALKHFVVGAGVSYMEGKADINKNGNYDDDEDLYLNGRRITPLKIVSHIKYIPHSRLFADIEWIYSGARNRFASQDNGSYRFGEGPVHSYGIVNLSAGYTLKGGINLFGGVENLLNKDYFPTTSQWYGMNLNYVKANGVRYQVGVGFKW